MSTAALETFLAHAVRATVRALPRQAALALGAGLGDTARRLGVRRGVARDNLAHAFPELPAAERERILAAHYRDVGMMLCETARGGASVYAPAGVVVAVARGLEHLEAARGAGRGAIILTGHYGSYGVMGGWLGRLNPVDIFSLRIRNPAVDAMVEHACREGGARRIVVGTGLKRVVAGLRDNRWLVMLGDQDVGPGGVFVPFLGRLASTNPGAAELALRTGAPLLMAFMTRRPDRRNEIDVLPPLTIERPDAPDAVERLTALHVATLEQWVRRHPEMWFWLHRRWKTPAPAADPVAPALPEAAPGWSGDPLARGA